MNADYQKIIIRMPNWIGDAVMATPVLKDVRSHFPHAEITALCQGKIGTLIQHDPAVNGILPFERNDRNKIFNYIKTEKFDLGILLTNSFSSAWNFWRSKIPVKVGFKKNFRSIFLSHPVDLPKNRENQHLIQTYKELLKPLNIPTAGTTPMLYVTKEEELSADKFLGDLGHHSIIGINPGAAYGSAKCWIPDRFRKVAEQLLEHSDMTIVFFGDAHGAALVQEICSGLPPRVINLAGKTTLRELMALIKKCSIFLTNDSGPMHIASALDIPVLALFGSTNPVATGPYGKAHYIQKSVPCSPCYKRTCPVPGFPCMDKIHISEVLETLNSLLKTYPYDDLSRSH